MTRATNARIAGYTYLVYIALAFPAMVLFNRATSAEGIAAKLTGIAVHAPDLRIAIVFSVICCFAALVLAVTLYAITRDEDSDLAMLALTCRVGEGVASSIPLVATVGLLWLATAASRENTPDTAAANALGMLLMNVTEWGTIMAATFFAVGSTLFAYLLLRGRMIPVSLAWLGIVGSLLVVVGLPLRLAGYLVGPVYELMWVPVGVFELVLGPWLLIKGVTPVQRLNDREKPGAQAE